MRELFGLGRRLINSPLFTGLARDGLLAMDPETAHRATINALKLHLGPVTDAADPPALATDLAGMTLANPVGLAAGFDKSGEVPEALGRMGFGLVEIGTVTPLPQAGNPQPRLFRLAAAGGVINRMGFNNDGHEAVYFRLAAVRSKAKLGVNIGANKTSADFVADYVAGVQRFYGIADYLTVNVSSPNTPGLRDLQADEALRRLLGAVLEARAGLNLPRRPIFLKLAPDLDEAQLDAIAAVVLATDLDGLIVANTTISREAVNGQPHASEAGGLSGKPLFALATRRLAQVRQRVGALPIIAVGGITSPQTALAKFEAGADAIQLYTGLVFQGFELLPAIKSALATRLATVKANRRIDDWAAGRVTL